MCIAGKPPRRRGRGSPFSSSYVCGWEIDFTSCRCSRCKLARSYARVHEFVFIPWRGATSRGERTSVPSRNWLKTAEMTKELSRARVGGAAWRGGERHRKERNGSLTLTVNEPYKSKVVLLRMMYDGLLVRLWAQGRFLGTMVPFLAVFKFLEIINSTFYIMT